MPTSQQLEQGGGAAQTISVPAGTVRLDGDLWLPAGSGGVVIFAHGSGSSRHSPRNRFVAQALRQVGLGALLLDLLSAEEEQEDAHTGRLRFNIDFLANRLLAATQWLQEQPPTRPREVGYFGASTGAAAALQAATQVPQTVKAIVSRGGRPDLAERFLGQVTTPTLLVVGGNDWPVIEVNESALNRLAARQKQLIIIPGATHLFEEPGALDEVARLATEWFSRYLTAEPVS
jgi:putative phosphoribosyl transferase